MILHMCTINDNHIMYGSWDMEHDGHNFLSFWTIYPTNNPKMKNFEKREKPGDIIILDMCMINDNQMVYGSWDMEGDGQNFLWFYTLFYTFTPLTTWKIKLLK